MDITSSADDIGGVEKKKGGGKKKRMALERLRMASEKLQLARLKATITFIALGFGAYKLFYARHEEGKEPLLDFITGRDVGIFLIGMGFFALLLATVQHVKSLADLKKQYQDMPYSVTLYLSYLVMVLSLILLYTVVFQL